MSPSAIQEEPQSNSHVNSAAGEAKNAHKKRTYEKTKAALALERKYAAGNYHPLGILCVTRSFLRICLIV